MYSNSFAWSFAFIGTAARPACQQAKSTSQYSGQFFIAIATRSPGFNLKVFRIPADRRATRPERDL